MIILEILVNDMFMNFNKLLSEYISQSQTKI